MKQIETNKIKKKKKKEKKKKKTAKVVQEEKNFVLFNNIFLSMSIKNC